MFRPITQCFPSVSPGDIRYLPCHVLKMRPRNHSNLGRQVIHPQILIVAQEEQHLMDVEVKEGPRLSASLLLALLVFFERFHR